MNPRLRFWIRTILRLFVCGGSALAIYVLLVWSSLPDVTHLSDTNPETSAYRVYFSVSYPVPEERSDPNWTPASELPPILFRALIHSEDNRFLQHEGVDWKTTRRATRRWLQGRASGGGSTITQQLARNLYLSPSQTPHRKFKEILLALRMEQHMSKERILEVYANLIEYGEGLWGITYAAEYYFQTTPQELTAFEIVFLCSLLPAPRAELQGANLERALKVQRRVSQNLFLEEAISADTFDEIKARRTRLQGLLETGTPLLEALQTSKKPEPNTPSET